METGRLSPNVAQIAVTGVGCLSALGGNFLDCMKNLFAGQRNISYKTLFLPDLADSYPLFAVDDGQVQWRQHLRNRSRTAQMAVATAAEALADAAYGPTELAAKRVGVCMGTTVGNMVNNETFYRLYRRGGDPELSEIDRYFQSNPAELVAREFNLQGPVMTVSNACSSGTDAVGIALSWLRADLCDIVLAGGSDELSHISCLGFRSLMISSEKPCIPFDRYRDGLNLGEGAATLVLEKALGKTAEKCILNSYASVCDAYHLTAPHPDGLGVRKALTVALRQAGMPKIAFINAHGTATINNDEVEMQVFADMFPQVPYYSVKGCTGHTLGAAGAIEAAITVGCLVRGEIPASPGFTELPEDAMMAPTTGTHAITGSYAISQSLAFGGGNAVVIFQR